MHFLTTLLPKIELLGSWSYWIILLITILESTAFVGLLVPGTTVLIFAGFLAAQGILDFNVLIWLAAIGGILGDATSFYLGRRGIQIFKPESKLFKMSHLEKGELFFKNHGEKSVVLARFIGPLRPLIPFIAGLFKMRVSKFFLYNIISGFLAAVVYLTLGYFFGGIWGQVRHVVRIIEVPLLIALVAGLVGYLWRKELFK